jgi:predicted phage terminase large subunit-like protein
MTTLTSDTWRDLDAWDKARLRWRLLTDLSPDDPRPNQLTPDGDWLIWLIMAGRGWGKSRTGAEDVSDYARGHPGHRIAAVSGDYAEGRDVMIEGESGLLSVVPPDAIRSWNRSLGELIFTNGARVDLYSAEKPDALRGPQHHRCWADELAKWRYLQDTWDMLMFGLRLGDRPQCVITTTPKPVGLLRDIAARSTTQVTQGTMFDNARNLAPSALEELRARYEGSRLGRQELYGELLEDLGFVFDRRWFDLVEESPAGPGWQRIRYWDLAGTPGSEIPGQSGDFAAEDPDWTAGALLAWHPQTRHLVVEDMRHVRRSPGEVERLVLSTAAEDGRHVAVWIEEEPGQSGKAQVATYSRLLPGHLVHGDRPSGPKLVRAQLLAQLAEQSTQDPPLGKVTLLSGRPWTQHLLDELEVFTGDGKTGHDDMVDACSGGLKVLSTGPAPGGGTSASAMSSMGPLRRR